MNLALKCCETYSLVNRIDNNMVMTGKASAQNAPLACSALLLASSMLVDVFFYDLPPSALSRHLEKYSEAVKVAVESLIVSSGCPHASVFLFVSLIRLALSR